MLQPEKENYSKMENAAFENCLLVSFEVNSIIFYIEYIELKCQNTTKIFSTSIRLNNFYFQKWIMHEHYCDTKNTSDLMENILLNKKFTSVLLLQNRANMTDSTFKKMLDRSTKFSYYLQLWKRKQIYFKQLKSKQKR